MHIQKLTEYILSFKEDNKLLDIHFNKLSSLRKEPDILRRGLNMSAFNYEDYSKILSNIQLEIDALEANQIDKKLVKEIFNKYISIKTILNNNPYLLSADYNNIQIIKDAIELSLNNQTIYLLNNDQINEINEISSTISSISYSLDSVSRISDTNLFASATAAPPISSVACI